MVVQEASINNIMGGLEGAEGVKLHTHRRKLKQRFDIIKKLGQGTYGKVQLGINKETGQEVAIKTIKKAKIETEGDLIRIRREIQIMSSLRHPYIIHIYEVFENKDKIVLVMEYAAGGELYDYLSQRKVLQDVEAQRLFRQIAMAVYYCHKHQICHRDLKLENILLDEDGNAKLADFGLSNVFDSSRLLSTFCGSPLYASPEIVSGIPYYGPEVDCWSLGVLLYTLVYGAMPFDGSNFKRLVKQISHGEYYEPKTPSSASGLIRSLLTVDGSERLDIVGVCSHSWLNSDEKEMPCVKKALELSAEKPVRLDLLLSLNQPRNQAAVQPQTRPAVVKSRSVGSLPTTSTPAPSVAPLQLPIAEKAEKEAKANEVEPELPTEESLIEPPTDKVKKKPARRAPSPEPAVAETPPQVPQTPVKKPLKKPSKKAVKEAALVEEMLTIETEQPEVPSSQPEPSPNKQTEPVEAKPPSPLQIRQEEIPLPPPLEPLPPEPSSPVNDFKLASTVHLDQLIRSEIGEPTSPLEKLKKENALKVISHAISESSMSGERKSSTLPRRRLSRPEVSPPIAPTWRSGGPGTAPVAASMVANTRSSQFVYPTPAPRTSLSKEISKEESGPGTSRERIIPIAVESRESTSSTPVGTPPVQQVGPVQSTSAPAQPMPRQTSLRQHSLSREGSESGSSVSSLSMKGEPVRKSPREVIIPIAMEGGGYLTPPLREEEGSTSTVGTGTTTAGAGSRVFGLASTRPPRPSMLDTQDSLSSDEDDDNFEILTAENLFSTLLSRVRSLTQRLNEDTGRASAFPRLFSHDSVFDNPSWSRRRGLLGQHRLGSSSISSDSDNMLSRASPRLIDQLPTRIANDDLTQSMTSRPSRFSSATLPRDFLGTRSMRSFDESRSDCSSAPGKPPMGDRKPPISSRKKLSRAISDNTESEIKWRQSSSKIHKERESVTEKTDFLFGRDRLKDLTQSARSIFDRERRDSGSDRSQISGRSMRERSLDRFESSLDRIESVLEEFGRAGSLVRSRSASRPRSYTGKLQEYRNALDGRSEDRPSRSFDRFSSYDGSSTSRRSSQSESEFSSHDANDELQDFIRLADKTQALIDRLQQRHILATSRSKENISTDRDNNVIESTLNDLDRITSKSHLNRTIDNWSSSTISTNLDMDKHSSGRPMFSNINSTYNSGKNTAFKMERLSSYSENDDYEFNEDYNVGEFASHSRYGSYRASDHSPIRSKLSDRSSIGSRPDRSPTRKNHSDLSPLRIKSSDYSPTRSNASNHSPSRFKPFDPSVRSDISDVSPIHIKTLDHSPIRNNNPDFNSSISRFKPIDISPIQSSDAENFPIRIKSLDQSPNRRDGADHSPNRIKSTDLSPIRSNASDYSSNRFKPIDPVRSDTSNHSQILVKAGPSSIQTYSLDKGSSSVSNETSVKRLEEQFEECETKENDKSISGKFQISVKSSDKEETTNNDKTDQTVKKPVKIKKKKLPPKEAKVQNDEIKSTEKGEPSTQNSLSLTKSKENSATNTSNTSQTKNTDTDSKDVSIIKPVVKKSDKVINSSRYSTVKQYLIDNCIGDKNVDSGDVLNPDRIREMVKSRRDSLLSSMNESKVESKRSTNKDEVEPVSSEKQTDTKVIPEERKELKESDYLKYINDDEVSKICDLIRAENLKKDSEGVSANSEGKPVNNLKSNEVAGNSQTKATQDENIVMSDMKTKKLTVDNTDKSEIITDETKDVVKKVKKVKKDEDTSTVKKKAVRSLSAEGKSTKKILKVKKTTSKEILPSEITPANIEMPGENSPISSLNQNTNTSSLIPQKILQVINSAMETIDSESKLLEKEIVDKFEPLTPSTNKEPATNIIPDDKKIELPKSVSDKTNIKIADSSKSDIKAKVKSKDLVSSEVKITDQSNTVVEVIDVTKSSRKTVDSLKKHIASNTSEITDSLKKNADENQIEIISNTEKTKTVNSKTDAPKSAKKAKAVIESATKITDQTVPEMKLADLPKSINKTIDLNESPKQVTDQPKSVIADVTKAMNKTINESESTKKVTDQSKSVINVTDQPKSVITDSPKSISKTQESKEFIMKKPEIQSVDLSNSNIIDQTKLTSKTGESKNANPEKSLDKKTQRSQEENKIVQVSLEEKKSAEISIIDNTVGNSIKIGELSNAENASQSVKKETVKNANVVPKSETITVSQSKAAKKSAELSVNSENKTADMTRADKISDLPSKSVKKISDVPILENNITDLSKARNNEVDISLHKSEDKSVVYLKSDEKIDGLSGDKKVAGLVVKPEREISEKPVGKNVEVLKVKKTSVDLTKVGNEIADLPKSETKSSDLPKSETKTSDLPKSEIKSSDLPKSGDKSSDLPKSEIKSSDLPKSEIKSSDLPKSRDKSSDLPKSGDKTSDLSKSENKFSELPKTAREGVKVKRKTADLSLLESKTSLLENTSSDLSKSKNTSPEAPKSVNTSLDVPIAEEKAANVLKVKKTTADVAIIEKKAAFLAKSEIPLVDLLKSEQKISESKNIPLELSKPETKTAELSNLEISTAKQSSAEKKSIQLTNKSENISSNLSKSEETTVDSSKTEDFPSNSMKKGLKLVKTENKNIETLKSEVLTEIMKNQQISNLNVSGSKKIESDYVERVKSADIISSNNSIKETAVVNSSEISNITEKKTFKVSEIVNSTETKGFSDNQSNRPNNIPNLLKINQDKITANETSISVGNVEDENIKIFDKVSEEKSISEAGEITIICNMKKRNSLTRKTDGSGKLDYFRSISNPDDASPTSSKPVLRRFSSVLEKTKTETLSNELSNKSTVFSSYSNKNDDLNRSKDEMNPSNLPPIPGRSEVTKRVVENADIKEEVTDESLNLSKNKNTDDSKPSESVLEKDLQSGEISTKPQVDDETSNKSASDGTVKKKSLLEKRSRVVCKTDESTKKVSTKSVSTKEVPKDVDNREGSPKEKSLLRKFSPKSVVRRDTSLSRTSPPSKGDDIPPDSSLKRRQSPTGIPVKTDSFRKPKNADEDIKTALNNRERSPKIMSNSSTGDVKRRPSPKTINIDSVLKRKWSPKENKTPDTNTEQIRASSPKKSVSNDRFKKVSPPKFESSASKKDEREISPVKRGISPIKRGISPIKRGISPKIDNKKDSSDSREEKSPPKRDSPRKIVGKESLTLTNVSGLSVKKDEKVNNTAKSETEGVVPAEDNSGKTDISKEGTSSANKEVEKRRSIRLPTVTKEESILKKPIALRMNLTKFGVNQFEYKRRSIKEKDFTSKSFGTDREDTPMPIAKEMTEQKESASEQTEKKVVKKTRLVRKVKSDSAKTALDKMETFNTIKVESDNVKADIVEAIIPNSNQIEDSLKTASPQSNIVTAKEISTVDQESTINSLKSSSSTSNSIIEVNSKVDINQKSTDKASSLKEPLNEIECSSSLIDSESKQIDSTVQMTKSTESTSKTIKRMSSSIKECLDSLRKGSDIKPASIESVKIGSKTVKGSLISVKNETISNEPNNSSNFETGTVSLLANRHFKSEEVQVSSTSSEENVLKTSTNELSAISDSITQNITLASDSASKISSNSTISTSDFIAKSAKSVTKSTKSSSSFDSVSSKTDSIQIGSDLKSIINVQSVDQIESSQLGTPESVSNLETSNSDVKPKSDLVTADSIAEKISKMRLVSSKKSSTNSIKSSADTTKMMVDDKSSIDQSIVSSSEISSNVHNGSLKLSSVNSNSVLENSLVSIVTSENMVETSSDLKRFSSEICDTSELTSAIISNEENMKNVDSSTCVPSGDRVSSDLSKTKGKSRDNLSLDLKAVKTVKKKRIIKRSHEQVKSDLSSPSEKSVLEKFLELKPKESRIEKTIKSLRRNSLGQTDVFTESNLLKRATSMEDFKTCSDLSPSIINYNSDEEVFKKKKKGKIRKGSVYDAIQSRILKGKSENSKETPKTEPEETKTEPLESPSTSSNPQFMDESASYSNDNSSELGSFDLGDGLSEISNEVEDRIKRKSFYMRFNPTSSSKTKSTKRYY